MASAKYAAMKQEADMRALHEKLDALAGSMKFPEGMEPMSLMEAPGPDFGPIEARLAELSDRVMARLDAIEKALPAETPRPQAAPPSPAPEPPKPAPAPKAAPK